jgi:hypothetical protein
MASLKGLGLVRVGGKLCKYERGPKKGKFVRCKSGGKRGPVVSHSKGARKGRCVKRASGSRRCIKRAAPKRRTISRTNGSGCKKVVMSHYGNRRCREICRGRSGKITRNTAASGCKTL